MLYFFAPAAHALRNGCFHSKSAFFLLGLNLTILRLGNLEEKSEIKNFGLEIGEIEAKLYCRAKKIAKFSPAAR